jgi:hypothetical protein
MTERDSALFRTREIGRCPTKPPWGKVEFDAAERLEQGLHGLTECLLPVLWGRDETLSQESANLLFHGTPMSQGTRLKAKMEIVFDVTDDQSRHGTGPQQTLRAC